VTGRKVDDFWRGETEMVGKENFKTEDLNLFFENLMMVAGGEKGGNMKVGVITEWKDIPVELLMQILSLVDDQTVIRASGVCRGWRDSIYFGLARLSLSWYILISLLFGLYICGTVFLKLVNFSWFTLFFCLN